MFEKCGNKRCSSSEHETYLPSILLVHALVHDDVLMAYVFGAGIGLGLLHCNSPYMGILFV